MVKPKQDEMLWQSPNRTICTGSGKINSKNVENSFREYILENLWSIWGGGGGIAGAVTPPTLIQKALLFYFPIVLPEPCCPVMHQTSLGRINAKIKLQ